MRAIIGLKNNNDSISKFELNSGFINLYRKNFGIPDGVEITVTIDNEKEEKSHQVSYSEFLASFIHEPVVASVSTTNNRQVDFYVMDVWGGRQPFVPQLTISGKMRHGEWNEKKYNIADTGEMFIMDGKEIISISLKPKQDFQIKFQMSNTVKVIHSLV